MERLTFKDKDCVHYEERQDIKVTNSQLLDKLGEYEDLEERLQAVYGECGGLLEKVVEHLERHVEIDFPDPVFKARLLTDDEVDRWREYKKLDEQGKLLKLPCAVGDTVYRICPKCNDAHNGSCKNCAWENSCSNQGCTVYGGWKDGQYPKEKCTIVPYKVFWNYIPNLLENIGRRVFLTREAAEAALKEL